MGGRVVAMIHGTWYMMHGWHSCSIEAEWPNVSTVSAMVLRKILMVRAEKLKIRPQLVIHVLEILKLQTKIYLQEVKRWQIVQLAVTNKSITQSLKNSAQSLWCMVAPFKKSAIITHPVTGGNSIPRVGPKSCFPNDSFVCYHSISITWPKFKVQLHSALNRDILFDKAFFTKILLCPLSFIWPLGNLCSSSGGCAMKVAVQAYFWRILQLSFIHECWSIKEWPKSAENMSAW